MIDWVDGDASAPSHFVTSLRAPWGCIAPVMKHAAYSYTAVGLSLLVLHVGILFAPFAEDVASGWLTGVIYLAMSLTDVAAMFADVYEALTHRITWAEVLPLAAPNAAGLAGGGALLISGLLVCEHTPPRRLGAFVALCLFASATPFHPYGSAAPRVLGRLCVDGGLRRNGGFVLRRAKTQNPASAQWRADQLSSPGDTAGTDARTAPGATAHPQLNGAQPCRPDNVCRSSCAGSR